MKRQPLNTIAGAKEIASKAKVIKFPKHIHKWSGAEVFFNNIIKARASSLWAEHEIDIAAFLANDEAKIAEHEKKLAQEGEIIVYGDKPIANPRCGVMRDLKVMVKQNRQTLGLQEAAKGNPADRKKRNELAQNIEAGLNQPTNSLLAN